MRQKIVKMVVLIVAGSGSWYFFSQTDATKATTMQSCKQQEGIITNETAEDLALYQLPNGLIFNSLIR
jgi:hypothetical protein